MSATTILAKELETYERKKAELLEKFEGKVVAIKGDEIMGVFDNEKDALEAVLKKYGYVPVLIKRITREEKPEHIPAYTYGLLSVFIEW